MNVSKRWLLLTFLVLLILLIAIGVLKVKASLEQDLATLNAIEIDAVDVSQLSDGDYEGEFRTVPVSARVRVTLLDGRIENIDLLEHNNGQGKPAEAILQEVVEQQSLAVDIIAGATYSSKVILKAVENALTTNP
ncbi:MAG: FMN-binding protein [Eubacteriales bacterium]|nr:FMN-binding protein [Eubacteriales bacterium]